ncbi:MAG TPA: hypothetical protein VNV36_09900 [Pseudomonas sp.]|uniref:hypothetical protein n=1 Tax=Pseudomonas sp. TaxID=306 RepID=UPI002CF69AC2|nr:hypothetical protein [Pseudomonas sp.]HWH87076.1 hypothetical protein [Pseudomonas sp.]
MKTVKWLALLMALSSPQAQALNQEIRALFQPDPSRPDKNGFVNKTPNSGYCAQYPGQCAAQSIFSIELPVRFTATRGLSNLYDWTSVKAPSDWRRVTVTNPETQETQTLEVRISGMGSTYVLPRRVTTIAGGSSALEGHGRLWKGGDWANAIPAPCQYSGAGAYGDTHWRFFWKTPQAGHCFKEPAVFLPEPFYFDKLDFAYELRTPDPLKMSTGRYTGSINYSLGYAGDFDMGKLLEPDVRAITLDFVLDVQHTLKVDIPPGGDKIVLEPQGGWQRWLAGGSKPVRIFRDQTFHISASSAFSMKLECEHDMGFGSGCGIINPDTRYAGLVEVSVSLPNNITDSAGQPVRRKPLSGQATGPFQPVSYAENKPGTLHFEVAATHLDWLINNAGDRPYRGNITVIWDSEVR